MARTAPGIEWRKARVGALLVVALLGLMLAVYQVGKVFDVFASRYSLYTLVTSASGLRQGAPVTVAGQRVGKVASIEFIPLDRKIGPDHLRLELSIDERVRSQIRTNSVVYIRMQGLLGDRYIDIQPGTPEARVLAAGEVLPSDAPMDLDQIMTTAGETLDEVTQFVQDLRRLTGSMTRGEGTVGRLLADDALYQRMVGATVQLTATLQSINQSQGTVGRLIRDPELYDRLTVALGRLDALTAQALDGGGTIGQLLSSDTLHRGLLGVVGRADSALLSIGSGLAGLTDGEGTLQRLLTDPALYDELLKAVVDLQTLLLDIRENPRRYRPEVNVDIF
jgi:phospholipid/cholesterol/gamma-HCH transport system substrate-binding protein